MLKEGMRLYDSLRYVSGSNRIHKLNVTLDTCKTLCIANIDCVYIDYFAEQGRCRMFYGGQQHISQFGANDLT